MCAPNTEGRALQGDSVGKKRGASIGDGADRVSCESIAFKFDIGANAASPAAHLALCPIGCVRAGLPRPREFADVLHSRY